MGDPVEKEPPGWARKSAMCDARFYAGDAYNESECGTSFSISTGENWPENCRLYQWSAVACCMPYSALVVLQ